MKIKIFDPGKSALKMNIVCFVSGSGTNYREIYNWNPDHNYIVFSNRPDCEALEIARRNNHDFVILSHIPFLKDAKDKYQGKMLPRNCPERISFEKDAVKLIEDKLGGKSPDLICLAGYDQWNSDWFVDRYYPRILNVHPGDTTKSYTGLHWIPTAKALISGEEYLRSTLFIVDKGADTGPVLMQSKPLHIEFSLDRLSNDLNLPLLDNYNQLKHYIKYNSIKSFKDFKNTADKEIYSIMELICKNLQGLLKVEGDWEIYPFGVHELIGRGRVELDGRQIIIDGEKVPAHGYRPD
jgi:folate-dependent phosphoribosylglycinamide formyltransferase PurN